MNASSKAVKKLTPYRRTEVSAKEDDLQIGRLAKRLDLEDLTGRTGQEQKRPNHDQGNADFFHA